MFRNRWMVAATLAIGASILAPHLVCQWVPVSGRVETTVEAVAADGTVNTKWTTTSLYARSANGSIVTQTIGKSGRPALGTLIDSGRSGKVFKINYRDGKITDTHHPLNHSEAAKPTTTFSVAEKNTALGHEMYAGEECYIMPVYDSGPNQTIKLIGKAWVAPRLNGLILKEDVIHQLPGGGSRHVIKKFTILKQGVEPKSELFAADSPSIVSYGKKQAEVR